MSLLQREPPFAASDALIRAILEALNVIYIRAGLIYLRVACDDPGNPDFRMPRNEWTLTTAELRIIHDWIMQGAPSAEEIFASRFDARGHCP